MRECILGKAAVRSFVFTLAFAWTGCTGNVQYRVGDAAVEHHEVDDGHHYDLAYVEFDEQGDFWDRDQLKRAVDLVQSKSRPLLVVYVHGWQNNASPNTNDVPQFHDLMAKLARTPGIRNYQTVGIYLGWRGKQAYDPL